LPHPFHLFVTHPWSPGELGTVKLEEDDRVAIVKGVDPLWKEEQFWNYFG